MWPCTVLENQLVVATQTTLGDRDPCRASTGSVLPDAPHAHARSGYVSFSAGAADTSKHEAESLSSFTHQVSHPLDVELVIQVPTVTT